MSPAWLMACRPDQGTVLQSAEQSGQGDADGQYLIATPGLIPPAVRDELDPGAGMLLARALSCDDGIRERAALNQAELALVLALRRLAAHGSRSPDSRNTTIR